MLLSYYTHLHHCFYYAGPRIYQRHWCSWLIWISPVQSDYYLFHSPTENSVWLQPQNLKCFSICVKICSWLFPSFEKLKCSASYVKHNGLDIDFTFHKQNEGNFINRTELFSCPIPATCDWTSWNSHLFPRSSFGGTRYYFERPMTINCSGYNTMREGRSALFHC